MKGFLYSGKIHIFFTSDQENFVILRTVQWKVLYKTKNGYSTFLNINVHSLWFFKEQKVVLPWHCCKKKPFFGTFIFFLLS